MTQQATGELPITDSRGLPRSAEPHLAGWRAAVSRAGYATVLIVAVASTWGLMRVTDDAGAAAGAVVFVVAMVTWAFERLLPHFAAWQPTLRSFRVDLVHTLVSAYAVAPAVRASLLVALAAAATGNSSESRFWPQDWPLIAELALAVVVADFGAYWAHRFMHLSRLGWRMHAVHHSLVHMNFIASARSHPFNAVLTFSCETGLLILLGIPAEVMALWTVVKASNGLLQHSNVDLRPSRLSAVIATCDIHRWHHSVILDESNRNFGNTTTLWDRLFGTLLLPTECRASSAVGIDAVSIPEGYLAHLATPFLLSRYERQDTPQPPSR